MRALTVFGMICSAAWLGAVHTASAEEAVLDLSGVVVTPHMKLDSMRYMQEPEPAVGARIQLFLRHDEKAENPLTLDGGARLLFDGESPDALLAAQRLSWHDAPAASPDAQMILPPGAMTVWTLNGKALPFGPGGRVRVEAGPADSPWLSQELAIDQPVYWLSAVTFFPPKGSLHPDTMIVHLVNASDQPLEMRFCRLWLPQTPQQPRVLLPQPAIAPLSLFNGQTTIPPGDKGGFTVKMGPQPLTYAAVEVTAADAQGKVFSIWSYLRIKPETFDISGGWVNGGGNPVAHEIFLKALKRLHVNTAHLAITPGYSDTELYDRYPLKYFNKLQPFELYDVDEMLPRIHAVEFLGEPQFGGGQPVPPQEVWRELQPYTVTRLATTVTHSEERIWRDYAGLSDYPHYDAYRVTAPSPDAWHKYERWGKRIYWGSPLETIGDMCRSLRELNRPMPCAIWSQGPHEGWGRYGGRGRTSPTPDEIRLQAYHALSTRITSLYWFNLSLKTLVQWRDTLEELERIGREIRMLDEFYIEGDAFQFERLSRGEDQWDWDIASVCGPRAALLFALDLDYQADHEERVFTFGAPRPATFLFNLPAYLRGVTDVFRVDADGVYEVKWERKDGAVEINDNMSRVGIYVAALDGGLRGHIENKRQRLIAEEQALQFDPARNDDDFAALEALLHSLQK